ncbi:class I SAM-dependent methyltransferase [Blastococcus sp. SYSU D00669]
MTAPRPVTGDSELQSQTLASVAQADNYHRWLTDLARPHLGDHPVELGSGLGDYAERWLAGGVPRITVTEADPSRLDVLRQRFADRPEVRVRAIDVFSPEPGDHSAYVAFNVLEHIEDHVGALRAAHTLLRPGGRVVMFVPAFAFAMSRFDREIGHVRRYRRKDLSGAMTAAGLEVLESRYVNMPGLPAWFVAMRLLKQTPGEHGGLAVWDRVVVPAARWTEERVRAPFGQSVFAVARVPER